MSKIFNDPIHGRIEIPEHCIKIIDTIEFQRLRNLKQLGLTSYVFYGATQTRFEHSIGVCWISGKWAKHLQRKHPELGITSDDIKTVQIAGLVHDIGHGPFSHTFERFIKKTRPDIKYNHEDMTLKIFRSMDSGCDHETVENVCKIIEGTPLEQNPFLGHIVHNTINGLDADKLDYFIRDSQCTSFAIGCDWKRIVYESSVKDNEIVFPYKMVGDIFNVYQTRFRLYKEVYYHKTVCMIEDTLLETMFLADKSGVFDFRGSSLSHSIDNVSTFLLTQDDIIGQMERCNVQEISNVIDGIKKRYILPIHTHEPRIAHYGMGDENPLDFVKFVNKEGNYQQIDKKILESMCPQKFSVIV
jgi:deoxynucleoside triphosphate triphosphohydrolase SAMHD1